MYQLVVQDINHATGCSWLYLARSHDPEKDHVNTNLDRVHIQDFNFHAHL